MERLEMSGNPSAGRKLDNIEYKEHQTKNYQGPSGEAILAPARKEEKDGKYNEYIAWNRHQSLEFARLAEYE
jgi:hypothetical protein